MLLILPPSHGTSRVYYRELWDFTVQSVTFLLFARYYGISCVRVSTYAHDFQYQFGYRQVGVHIQ